MTPDIDIIEYLRSRDRELNSSRPGGQWALLELVREAQQIPGSQSESLAEALLQLIRDSDPDLSAFAIEFLAQDPSGLGKLQLEGLLASATQSEEWFPATLLALVAEGYRPVRELATNYVRRHFAETDFPLALLTQLVAVAPEEGVHLGSYFLSRLLTTATQSELVSITQAFVNASLKHHQGCLIDLVRSLGERDLELAKSFAREVCDALAKPWIVKSHGALVAETLANQVRELQANW